MIDRLYRLSTLARESGISRYLLQRAITEQGLPSVEVAGVVFVRESDFTGWLHEQQFPYAELHVVMPSIPARKRRRA